LFLNDYEHITKSVYIGVTADVVHVHPGGSNFLFLNGRHCSSSAPDHRGPLYPQYEPPIELDLSDADFGPACFTAPPPSNVLDYSPAPPSDLLDYSLALDSHSHITTDNAPVDSSPFSVGGVDITPHPIENNVGPDDINKQILEPNHSLTADILNAASNGSTPPSSVDRQDLVSSEDIVMSDVASTFVDNHSSTPAVKEAYRPMMSDIALALSPQESIKDAQDHSSTAVFPPDIISSTTVGVVAGDVTRLTSEAPHLNKVFVDEEIPLSDPSQASARENMNSTLDTAAPDVSHIPLSGDGNKNAVDFGITEPHKGADIDFTSFSGRAPSVSERRSDGEHCSSPDVLNETRSLSVEKSEGLSALPALPGSGVDHFGVPSTLPDTSSALGPGRTDSLIPVTADVSVGECRNMNDGLDTSTDDTEGSVQSEGGERGEGLGEVVTYMEGEYPAVTVGQGFEADSNELDHVQTGHVVGHTGQFTVSAGDAVTSGVSAAAAVVGFNDVDTLDLDVETYLKEMETLNIYNNLPENNTTARSADDIVHLTSSETHMSVEQCLEDDPAGLKGSASSPWNNEGAVEKSSFNELENEPGTNASVISSVDNVPGISSMDNVLLSSAMDNVPVTSAIDNVSATSAVDNVPDTCAVDNVPDTCAVDNVPVTAAVYNVSVTSAMDNVSATSAVDNVPVTAAVDNVPVTFAMDNVPVVSSVDGQQPDVSSSVNIPLISSVNIIKSATPSSVSSPEPVISVADNISPLDNTHLISAVENKSDIKLLDNVTSSVSSLDNKDGPSLVVMPERHFFTSTALSSNQDNQSSGVTNGLPPLAGNHSDTHSVPVNGPSSDFVKFGDTFAILPASASKGVRSEELEDGEELSKEGEEFTEGEELTLTDTLGSDVNDELIESIVNMAVVGLTDFPRITDETDPGCSFQTVVNPSVVPSGATEPPGGAASPGAQEFTNLAIPASQESRQSVTAGGASNLGHPGVGTSLSLAPSYTGYAPHGGLHTDHVVLPGVNTGYTAAPGVVGHSAAEVFAGARQKQSPGGGWSAVPSPAEAVRSNSPQGGGPDFSSGQVHSASLTTALLPPNMQGLLK